MSEKKEKKIVQNKAKNDKKSKPKILNIIIVIIIIAIVVIIVNKTQNKYSEKEEISLIINNEDVTTDLQNEILIQDDIVYISFEDIKKCLDETIYLEEETNLIITSGDKKVAALKIDNSDIEINGAEVTIAGQALKAEGDTIYIPVSELENVYDIEFSYIEESKNAIIDYYSKKMEKAYVAKDISIKSERSNFSQTISKVEKGNWIVFVSEEEGWAKIRTQDGFLGYVKSKDLTNFVIEREDMEETQNSTDGEYLEKNITEEKITTYENRKELIEKILTETVSKEYKTVKIIYSKDIEDEAYERFKIEITPILKECGIKVIFE